MKKYLLAMAVALVLLCGCLSTVSGGYEETEPGSYEEALPMDAQVLVDGAPVDFRAYNIQGNHYFKLRDIAFVLNGTAKQIALDWDEAERTVRIRTGYPYTTTGGELSDLQNTLRKTAARSDAVILVDGMPASIMVYNIEGFSYFKLRDLGTAVGFSVSWDDALRMISIGTSPTAPDAPADRKFGESAYGYVEFIQNHLAKRVAGTQREKDAADYILSELVKAGYGPDQLATQTFSFEEEGQSLQSRNIIANLQGQSDQLIVVGAHYDSIESYGVEDNGSGLSVVLETANRLVNEQVPYTIRFIFFGAEEGRPLAKGAAYYVSTLTESEKQNILLMINLDSIMAGDKEYIFGGRYRSNGSVTDFWAAEQTKRIADALGLDMLLASAMDANLNSPSDRSDHVYFMAEDIPYVFFWAGNLDLLPISELRQTEKLGKILHTRYDDLNVINEHFPGRAKAHLSDYAALLYHVLKGIRPT